MRRFMKVLNLAVMFVTLALAGCFESEIPLLTDDDASMPFPSIYMAKINNAGQFVIDEKHEADASLFVPQGKHYRSIGGLATLMTLVNLGQQTDLTQEVLGAGGVVVYNIAKIEGDSLREYSPPEAGKTELDADFANAGVSVGIRNGDFLFNDKQQLLKAAEVFAAHLDLGSVEVYTIATSPSDIASLQQKVAEAEAAAPAVSPPAPTLPAAAPQVVMNDPGADAPNACDQQAAHPKDPGRMAQGVAMDAIVPALAVQACQKAVDEFPHTARFIYQLGRAEDASNNPEAAVADYKKAASIGYGMAWYNLGVDYEGDGDLPVDYQAAATGLRNAIAAGIDARSELEQLVFDPSGYSNPAFFSAVYKGRLSDTDAKSTSVYLGEFMQLFHNTPDCQDVVSTYAMGRLLMSEEFGAIGQMFGGLMQAHSGGDNGDFGQDAQQGWNAGMATTNGLLVQVSDARADAQLFYDREGCHSPVSRQFFHNVEVFAGGS